MFFNLISILLNTFLREYKLSETYKITTMKRNSFFLTLAVLCLVVCNAIAQTEPQKKKIKVQMFVNGKLHPANQTLTRADKDIQLKAFDAITNRELAITMIDASLVRNGQKLSSVLLPGSGSIEKLVSKAHNNDTYVFEIKKVLELADDLSLKPFSEKTFKVTYWFFDSELDGVKVAVGAN
jgi:hypothetical protein